MNTEQYIAWKQKAVTEHGITNIHKYIIGVGDFHEKYRNELQILLSQEPDESTVGLQIALDLLEELKP